MRWLLVVVLLNASCSKYVVAARPPELAMHANELVTRGVAEVTDPNGDQVRVAADTSIDVTVVEGDTQRPAHMTVRELVAGCVGDDSSPSCVAKQAVNAPITLRTGYRYDRSRLMTGLSFGVMGAAVGSCIALCQDGDQFARGILYGSIGIAGAIGFFAILIAAGGRD